MAHYDCRNCGAYHGIAYGYCKECTPPEVLTLDRKFKEACKAAKEEFDTKVAVIRDEFIERKVADARAKWRAAYDKYEPKRG